MCFLLWSVGFEKRKGGEGLGRGGVKLKGGGANIYTVNIIR